MTEQAFVTGLSGQVGSWLTDYLLEKTNISVHGLMRWYDSMDNIYHLSERINKKNVLIVKFDDIMNDFETVMKNIIEFTEVKETDALLANIKDTALTQKSYKSNHKYDLNKFGLTEDKIRTDCKPIYDTFLN